MGHPAAPQVPRAHARAAPTVCTAVCPSCCSPSTPPPLLALWAGPGRPKTFQIVRSATSLRQVMGPGLRWLSGVQSLVCPGPRHIHKRTQPAPHTHTHTHAHMRTWRQVPPTPAPHKSGKSYLFGTASGALRREAIDPEPTACPPPPSPWAGLPCTCAQTTGHRPGRREQKDMQTELCRGADASREKKKTWAGGQNTAVESTTAPFGRGLVVWTRPWSHKWRQTSVWPGHGRCVKRLLRRGGGGAQAGHKALHTRMSWCAEAALPSAGSVCPHPHLLALL